MPDINGNPKVGDTFFDATRDTNRNGVVIRVDYDDNLCVVRFHDTTDRDEYSWDDITWTDKFGGTWMKE